MLKFNKISRFNMVTKKIVEFVIFHQNFWQKCAIEPKFVSVKPSPTLGTLVSIKTKCIKLIFIGKITLVPVAFLMALSIYSCINYPIPSLVHVFLFTTILGYL